MSLTAIQDYVITTLKSVSSVWDAVGSCVMYVLVYVLMNVLLYRSLMMNGGHPWLAVAEVNAKTACVSLVVLFSTVIFPPHVYPLEYSPCAWARWIGQHSFAFFVGFNWVCVAVLSWLIHRMFNIHKQRLDRARNRGSVSSDEEAALAKKI
ncbi:hypothetical protein DAKH74_023030 [Maudiozyma humilis]|uniref:Uncharacterized protein n=1 Tax=Maudiozyma humilis TaxID=51915 RepID=A0AAV5RY69_MAUHU|nr:hypothetical protein DAKH74_023030 [Kazachstania humilis]